LLIKKKKLHYNIINYIIMEFVSYIGFIELYG